MSRNNLVCNPTNGKIMKGILDDLGIEVGPVFRWRLRRKSKRHYPMTGQEIRRQTPKLVFKTLTPAYIFAELWPVMWGIIGPSNVWALFLRAKHKKDMVTQKKVEWAIYDMLLAQDTNALIELCKALHDEGLLKT